MTVCFAPSKEQGECDCNYCDMAFDLLAHAKVEGIEFQFLKFDLLFSSWNLYVMLCYVLILIFSVCKLTFEFLMNFDIQIPNHDIQIKELSFW